jgi:TaqI-like C-terminal specificity domain/Eco57I restriction-modification methylase
LGINLLKSGGRLCFIVTNKWMKAGYGEALRRFFGESAWVESVINFGHAKQIFEDADVFPSILVARKPTAGPPPATARVCDIPRDTLRIDDLSNQIEAEGFELPREKLTADAWTLEPPGVMALMEKIRRVGRPLKEYAKVKPLYGIKTGLNEVFLIDTKTKEQLIASDKKSVELIKPYLRGQDIDRWSPEWAGLWMIFSRKGTRIDEYQAIKNYLLPFRQRLEPRPKDYAGHSWPGRKPGSYLWYELQDPVDYWQAFERGKICIQRIAFHSRMALDTEGYYLNDSAIILPTIDPWLLAVLNSPAIWYLAFQTFPHKKDEALAMDIPYVQELPIPVPDDKARGEVSLAVDTLHCSVRTSQQGTRAILDWLLVEFAVEKPSQKLQDLAALDANALVDEVKKARGKKKPLTVAGLKALKEEHVRSIVPLQTLAAEAQGLERQVADLVHAAYGLTPAEVALMWKTAPPRMPGERPVL